MPHLDHRACCPPPAPTTSRRSIRVTTFSESPPSRRSRCDLPPGSSIRRGRTRSAVEPRLVALIARTAPVVQSSRNRLQRAGNGVEHLIDLLLFHDERR